MGVKPKTHRFQGTIYKIWMMRHVDVPHEIGGALASEFLAASSSSSHTRQSAGARTATAGLTPTRASATNSKHNRAIDAESATAPKHIPVIAFVNGRNNRTTLVPAGGGRYRLQLNTELRKAARADAGDLIGVELRLDLESREIAVPDELSAVLKAHPMAQKEFRRLTPGLRRQLLLYYLRAKSPKARTHVTERFIDVLLERATLGASNRKSRRGGHKMP